MKIKIPKNKEKIIELAQDIADKDAELGAASPLARNSHKFEFRE